MQKNKVKNQSFKAPAFTLFMLKIGLFEKYYKAFFQNVNLKLKVKFLERYVSGRMGKKKIFLDHITQNKMYQIGFRNRRILF